MKMVIKHREKEMKIAVFSNLFVIAPIVMLSFAYYITTGEIIPSYLSYTAIALLSIFFCADTSLFLSLCYDWKQIKHYSKLFGQEPEVVAEAKYKLKMALAGFEADTFSYAYKVSKGLKAEIPERIRLRINGDS